MLPHLLLLLGAARVWADVSLKAPNEGSYSVSSGFTIEWEDDQLDPLLENLDTITALLCTYSGSTITCFNNAPVIPEQNIRQLNGKFQVPNLSQQAGFASDGKYFLQVHAKGRGGDTLHYSKMLTLSGMTGVQKAADSGDPPVDSVSLVPGSSVDPLQAMSTPYQSQTGRTRYAPVQGYPGTKMTVPLMLTRRFPTSAWTPFKTYMPQRHYLTTVTPTWTYSATTYVNYAAAQASPTHFYAASARLASNIHVQRKSRRRWDD